jgi:hypothetical protein
MTKLRSLVERARRELNGAIERAGDKIAHASHDAHQAIEHEVEAIGRQMDAETASQLAGVERAYYDAAGHMQQAAGVGAHVPLFPHAAMAAFHAAAGGAGGWKPDLEHLGDHVKEPEKHAAEHEMRGRELVLDDLKEAFKGVIGPIANTLAQEGGVAIATVVMGGADAPVTGPMAVWFATVGTVDTAAGLLAAPQFLGSAFDELTGHHEAAVALHETGKITKDEPEAIAGRLGGAYAEAMGGSAADGEKLGKMFWNGSLVLHDVGELGKKGVEIYGQWSKGEISLGKAAGGLFTDWSREGGHAKADGLDASTKVFGVPENAGKAIGIEPQEQH